TGPGIVLRHEGPEGCLLVERAGRVGTPLSLRRGGCDVDRVDRRRWWNDDGAGAQGAAHLGRVADWSDLVRGRDGQASLFHRARTRRLPVLPEALPDEL